MFLPTNLGNNTYTFRIQFNEKIALAVPSEPLENNLRSQVYSESDTNQQFKLINNYDGSYKIQNVNTSKFLEASSQDAYIIQAEETSSDRQNFYFETL